MECNYKARVLNFLYESIKKLKGIKW
jgi:hypothetical protein